MDFFGDFALAYAEMLKGFGLFILCSLGVCLIISLIWELAKKSIHNKDGE